MIEAQLSDGTVLEFPDGTSRDVIQGVVKRHVTARAGSNMLDGSTVNAQGHAVYTPEQQRELDKYRRSIRDAELAAATDPGDRAAVQRELNRLPKEPSGGAGAPTPAPAPMPAPSAPPDTGWRGAFGLDRPQRPGQDAGTAGVGDAGVRAYIGLKQLIGQGTPQDQAVLREQESSAANDPNPTARKFGQAAGNIAMTALPMAGAARGAYGLAKMLPGALKYLAGGLAGAGVSGGQGLLLDPGHGDTTGAQLLDKSKQAATDAAWGGGLGLAGSALGRTMTKLFTPSAEAEKLMQEGVNPTLQQGAESPMGRFIGGLTSGAIDVKSRQNQEVMDAFLKRVSPSLDTSHMTVSEKVGILKDNFEREFGAVLDGKKFKLTEPIRDSVWNAAQGAGKNLQPAAAEAGYAEMEKAGPAFNVTTPITMGRGKMEEYQGLLRDAADKYKGTGVLDVQTRTALMAAQDKYNQLVRDKALSPDELAALHDTTSRFEDFLRYKDAASKPSFHAKPSVNELQRSYASMGEGDEFASAMNPSQRELLEPAQRVMGMSPSQDEARTLISALKRGGKLATAGLVGAGAGMGSAPALALSPLYLTSLLGQTASGARALFGQTDAQKALAEILRKSAPYAAGIGQDIGGSNAP